MVVKAHPPLELILKEGFRAFGHEWQRLALFGAVIPAAILTIFYTLSFNFQQEFYARASALSVGEITKYLSIQAIPLVILGLLFPLLFALMAFIVKEQYQKRKALDPRKAWLLAEHQYGKLLLTVIIELIVLGLIFAVPGLLGVAIGDAIGSQGIAALFIFTGIILGFIYTIFFIFTKWVSTYENIHYKGALLRSKELTYHHWWDTFGRLFVIKLVGLAIYLVVSVLFLPLYLAGFIVSLSGNIVLYAIIQFISGIVFFATLLPVFSCISVYFLALVDHDKKRSR